MGGHLTDLLTSQQLHSKSKHSNTSLNITLYPRLHKKYDITHMIHLKTTPYRALVYNIQYSVICTVYCKDIVILF